ETFMTHGRLIPLTAVIVLALAACSKSSNPVSSPATSADTAPAVQAARQPTTRPEGTPQLVIEPDGVHIAYRIFGQGEPAVILVHGWATDANYWNAQLAPLKAKYTVVEVDLAGHGASSNNRTNWSMENYGEDVAVVARKLQNTQLVLVGHS